MAVTEKSDYIFRECSTDNCKEDKMELVKKEVYYNENERRAAECGDIYRTDIEEVLQASPFDDIIIRCDRCCEMIAYAEDFFFFRSGNKNRFAFCKRCANRVFGI